jgi:hypothetical protein
VVWSVKADGMDRPSYKITPCWVTSGQPGGPPCWTISLAFGLIGQNYLAIHQSYCKKLSNFSMHENSHYGVCGNNYSAQLMMDLCNSAVCHGPLLFFPRIFAEVYSGNFFSSRLPSTSPPPPPSFNEFVFVDPVPDPGDKMSPKKK